MPEAYESVSTWRQPLPTTTSPERRALVRELAAGVAALSPGRLRVAVDGRTAAGKTTFGHELAAALRELGRPTLRASLDDFKHPWADATERGYDRTTGAGYYRNPWDFRSVRELLLEPMGDDSPGRVVLCAHDPLTGVDHRGVVVDAPRDAVLIVDGVFAFRPEYDDLWHFRFWLEVDAPVSLARGIGRDGEREGELAALALHRDRYAVAERIYLAEVDPVARADVVLDNTDVDHPLPLRWLPLRE